MSYQSEMVFLSLKALLKQRRLSYADLAERLGSSEAAVKNMFHKRRVDLDRLDKICEVIGMSLFDFMALVGQHQDGDFHFDEHQEEFLMDHQGHFAFFAALLFHRKSLKQIAEENGLSAVSVHRYVRDLEALGLIERRSENHIIFHKRGRLVWRKGGPWMRKYYRDLTSKQAEIMVKCADHPDYLVNFGMFSLRRKDLDAFYREIEAVLTRYKDIAYQQFIAADQSDALVPVNWNVLVLPDILEMNPVSIPEL
jgi:transcriptional regulator with XRE-family HTH domain